MRNSSNTSTPKLKIVTIVAASIVVVGLVAVGTILTLKAISPKKVAVSSSAPHTVLSAGDILAAYQHPHTIEALSGKAYGVMQDTTSQTMANISYKTPGQPYGIMTPAKNFVTYTAKSPSQPNATQSVQAETAAFMSQKGLSLVESAHQSTNSILTYTTYANDQTICQLSDSVPPAHSSLPASHQLACVSKTDIAKEYSAIKNLLALSPQAAQSNSPAQITRYTQSEGNKSFSTLSITDASGHPTTLLFGGVNDKWEYIGNLSDGSATKSAKYSLSPAVKQAINNPKYGGFIAKYIH